MFVLFDTGSGIFCILTKFCKPCFSGSGARSKLCGAEIVSCCYPDFYPLIWALLPLQPYNVTLKKNALSP